MSINESIKSIKLVLESNRLKVLEKLLIQDMCVCEMVDQLQMKHSLISYHLKILADGKLISKQKKGRHITYSIIPTKRDFIMDITDLIMSEKYNY